VATRSSNTLRSKQRDHLLDLRRRRTEPLPDPAECRAIRARAGITVEELAAAVGVSEASVYAWEIGTRVPGPRSRDRYAEALALLASGGESE
jgi:DNA-binding transcriptional regulator YiaG